MIENDEFRHLHRRFPFPSYSDTVLLNSHNKHFHIFLLDDIEVADLIFSAEQPFFSVHQPPITTLKYFSIVYYYDYHVNE